MKQYLVNIEFRYIELPKDEEYEERYRSETITLGIFDTFKEAADEGNKNLELMEKYFELNPNWDRKERFSEHGGCFGMEKYLIGDLGYLETPFTFFMRVVTLNYEPLEGVIQRVCKAVKYETDKNTNKV